MAEIAIATEADRKETSDVRGAVKPLREVKFVQNIGRFKAGKSVSDATFGACTLVFGENGWGKSTLADLLRSLTTDNPDIVIGRKTLAGGVDQKAVLRFGDQQAVFQNGTWSGIRPRIAVYDSVFVNENVFSGDVVSNEHLKKQYGLVVGEEGVRRVHRIVKLDEENRDNNNKIRIVETELNGIIKAAGPEGMTWAEFLALEVSDDIDTRIAEKDTEVKRASRAKELKAAAEPWVLPVPTETEEFRKCLHSKIEQMAGEAVKAVRDHIAKHEGTGRKGAMSHESWLESGTAFIDEEECAFCGQPLDERTLVDAYAEFFSDAYKTLATDVKTKRDTLARYANGDFRTRIDQIVTQNNGLYTYWQEAGKIEPPKLDEVGEAITSMENAASLLDAVFEQKQGNLTEAAAGEDVEIAIQAWDEGRKEIIRLNGVLDAKELKTLQSAKTRHHQDTVAVINRLDEHDRCPPGKREARGG